MKNLILIIAILFATTATSQINVLLHFTGNENAIKKVQDSLNFSYVKLERMIDVYSLVINDKATFKKIRAKVKRAPNAEILGGWNKKGKFFVFDETTDNFTRGKFKLKMKQYVEKDSIGNPMAPRDYTDEELNQGVINQIYGWGKREY